MSGVSVKGAAGGPKKGTKTAAEPAQSAEVAPAMPDDQQLIAVPKKKRNNNPGIRVQGGRVYDSENGTTCHQCRQKTAETKAKCTKCTLYFCPKCLENRYQERVEEVNIQPGWTCPRCRGDCNCSNCRKKQGKEATGQLANIAKKAGFGSVKDLLEKNPHAKALQLPKAPPCSSAAEAAAGGASAGGQTASNAAGGSYEASCGGDEALRRRPQQKRKAPAAAAEEELVPDEELPARQQAMPDAQPLAVHKSATGPAGASKRPRGGLAWVADVPEVTLLPEGQAGAELAVVLEFLQVFGPKLQLKALPLAAFAAELLQPPLELTAGREEGAEEALQQRQQQQKLMCPCSEDSLVAAVHFRLLNVVRTYWNVRASATPVSWQGMMRGYYAASLLTQRRALALRWQHGPPAVAGEIFRRPAQPEGGSGQEEGSQEEDQDEGQVEGGEAAVPAGGAAAAACVEYPAGGYWGLPPAARVAMLYSLVHDALGCEEIRKCIEESMGDALDEEKERRQQLAGVRKEARQAIARERDQQIALMVANASSGGLSLEEQQQMLEEARQRAEAAATTAAAAKVKALTEKVHPPTARAAVLGSDRDGRCYLQLQVAPLLTGEGGLVVQHPGVEGPHSTSQDGTGSSTDGGTLEGLGCYPAASLAGVAAALHPQGRREGPLQAALVRAFRLPPPAATNVTDGSSQGEGQEQGSGRGNHQQRQQQKEVAEQGEDHSLPAAKAAAAAEAAAAGRLKAAAQWRQPSVAPAAELAAQMAAEAVPQAARGGRKPAGVRGKSSVPAGAAPTKRRRQGDDVGAGMADGLAGGKPVNTQAGAHGAGGQRGGRSRRTSPRAASGNVGADKQAAGVAAAGAVGTRSRKAAAQQLPLKVEDMLPA